MKSISRLAIILIWVAVATCAIAGFETDTNYDPGAPRKAKNLSDLPDKAEARDNLSVLSIAEAVASHAAALLHATQAVATHSAESGTHSCLAIASETFVTEAISSHNDSSAHNCTVIASTSYVDEKVASSSSSGFIGEVKLYEGDLPEADSGQLMEVFPGWALSNGAIASNTALSADFVTRMNKKFNRPGDPTDSTRLSDRRGVFPKGFGQNGVLGANYANASGTPQADKFQGHFHSISDGTDLAARTSGAGGGTWSQGAGSDSNYWATIRGATTDDTSGNGTPRTGTITEPANVGVHYLVRIW